MQEKYFPNCHSDMPCESCYFRFGCSTVPRRIIYIQSNGTDTEIAAANELFNSSAQYGYELRVPISKINTIVDEIRNNRGTSINNDQSFGYPAFHCHKVPQKKELSVTL